MARRGVFDHPIVRRSAAIGSTEVTNFVDADLAQPRAYEVWQYGTGAPTAQNLVGTSVSFTENGAKTAVTDTDGPYAKFANSAIIGNLGGWSNFGGTRVTRLNWRPHLIFVVKSGATATDVDANSRLWVTLIDLPAGIASDTVANLVGFRYNPVESGDSAFWRCVTTDGANNKTVTTTTVAIAAATRYELEIDARTAGLVIFSINGVVVASHTTNLPAGATDLKAVAYVMNNNATARSFQIRRAVVTQQ